MPPITNDVVQEIDDATAKSSTQEIATYLRDQLGQRTTAYLVGAVDAKQVADYARGAKVSEVRERRLREGFKVVRMIETAYDTETAKAWLFGTNARLDDQAPVEVIAQSKALPELRDVRRAARQFASAEV